MKRLYVMVLLIGLLTIGMFGIAMDRAAAIEAPPTTNNPPEANAGSDQTVNEETLVELDGSTSYDPDDDDLTYSWTQKEGPPVTLSGASSPMPSFTATLVGSTGAKLTFELTVSDGFLESSDTVKVYVENVNHPPVADAGEDQTINEGNPVTLNGLMSKDPDGDDLTYSWTQKEGPPVTLSGASSPMPSFTAPLVGSGGETLVFELRVSDGLSTSWPDEVSIKVANINDPPSCDLAKPYVLWPPNHKMVPVAITGVADPDNDQVAITILSITQDEPVNGLGDGDTSPDAAISGNNALIRSERSGLGDGRIYTINFQAEDSYGGNCTGSVAVCVPHDMRPGTTCIDSGQSFNSFAR